MHHPLFAQNDKVYNNLPVNIKIIDQFKQYMNDVDLCLWGHIHWFDVFYPYTINDIIIKKGRCVGNGSAESQCSTKLYNVLNFKNIDTTKYPIPISMCQKPNNDNKCDNSIAKYPEMFANTYIGNGFVIMDIDNKNINTQYFALNYKSLTSYNLNLLYEENI